MTRLFQQSVYTFRVQTLSASLFEAVWVDILYWCAFHLIRPLRYTKEGRVQRPSINGADNRLDIFSSTSPRSNSKRKDQGDYVDVRHSQPKIRKLYL